MSRNVIPNTTKLVLLVIDAAALESEREPDEAPRVARVPVIGWEICVTKRGEDLYGVPVTLVPIRRADYSALLDPDTGMVLDYDGAYPSHESVEGWALGVAHFHETERARSRQSAPTTS